MELEAYLDDTSTSRSFQSHVPVVTTTEDCLLGIDEAGRGPVLGPMVYGICYCPVKERDRLQSMKFADSKTLNEEQREKLFEEINDVNDFMGWMIDVISPNGISNNMLRRAKYNLNLVSHDTAIGLIKKALSCGVRVKEVYVDTVGDPEKYQEKLKELFPGISVTVAKKADSTFPIVSAASICAKVARDNILKNWKFKENVIVEPNSWGSGYPGDPATKAFLNNHIDPVFGYPQIVRFSWSTADKILEEKAVKVDWESDDDESNSDGGPSLLAYFQFESNRSAVKKEKSHEYFTDRHLKTLTSW